jgi:hypothetical protein
MEKIEARFICLDEPAFFSLLETLYARLKGKDKGDKWISGDEVMRLLNISSPTTLQKLRDTGALRISQLSKKIILYDRDSVEEYIEKHSRKTWH